MRHVHKRNADELMHYVIIFQMQDLDICLEFRYLILQVI